MAKLKISQYNQKFPKVFEREKKRISKTIGGNEIHHIGSTAVPGLGGKGTIDIMIEIKSWKEAKRYFKLKLEWLNKVKGNRAKYTKLKEKYVKEILKK